MPIRDFEVVTCMIFFSAEKIKVFCFFLGSLITRLKLPNNSTRGVDEVL